MAEVVEYRLEKFKDELKLLVEFGLFTKNNAKEVLAKRRDFEYTLRRRTRTKLDYLKYIKYEINFLDSLDKYRKTVLTSLNNGKKADDKSEEVDRRILLLQSRKLSDIIRSRSAHISSIFRKLTTSFQFDENLWLAYIDFANSRKWNSRVSALYWRLLRVSNTNPKLWILAAEHEVEINKAYDVARGLYLRAIRHLPASVPIWIGYMKMEIKFMNVVDQRAQIVFKTLKSNSDSSSIDDQKNQPQNEAIWDEDPGNGSEPDEGENCDMTPENIEVDEQEDPKPTAKAIDDDDQIIRGHLPKIIYDNATKSLGDEAHKFILEVMRHIFNLNMATKGLTSLKKHIQDDLESRLTNDSRRQDLWTTMIRSLESQSITEVEDKFSSLFSGSASCKRFKSSVKRTSTFDEIYEVYRKGTIVQARKFYMDLLKKEATLGCFVGAIEVEILELEKTRDKKSQIDKIRELYEKAIGKYGTRCAKLWYEYMQFEFRHCNKTLEDLDRLTRIYNRAKYDLVDQSKVNTVIEKYSLLQANSTLDYSDYSDLD